MFEDILLNIMFTYYFNDIHTTTCLDLYQTWLRKVSGVRV